MSCCGKSICGGCDFWHHLEGTNGDTCCFCRVERPYPEEGFERVTTHIFDADDPYLKSDAVFGVKESLVSRFNRIDGPDKIAEAGFDGPYWDAEFDFVLTPV